MSTLNEQPYFVCETASQSTKRQEILEISGWYGPLSPPGYVCADVWHCTILKFAQAKSREYTRHEGTVKFFSPSPVLI